MPGQHIARRIDARVVAERKRPDRMRLVDQFDAQRLGRDHPRAGRGCRAPASGPGPGGARARPASPAGSRWHGPRAHAESRQGTRRGARRAARPVRRGAARFSDGGAARHRARPAARNAAALPKWMSAMISMRRAGQYSGFLGQAAAASRPPPAMRCMASWRAAFSSSRTMRATRSRQFLGAELFAEALDHQREAERRGALAPRGRPRGARAARAACRAGASVPVPAPSLRAAACVSSRLPASCLRNTSKNSDDDACSWRFAFRLARIALEHQPGDARDFAKALLRQLRRVQAVEHVFQQALGRRTAPPRRRLARRTSRCPVHRLGRQQLEAVVVDRDRERDRLQAPDAIGQQRAPGPCAPSARRTGRRTGGSLRGSSSLSSTRVSMVGSADQRCWISSSGCSACISGPSNWPARGQAQLLQRRVRQLGRHRHLGALPARHRARACRWRAARRPSSRGRGRIRGCARRTGNGRPASGAR